MSKGAHFLGSAIAALAAGAILSTSAMASGGSVGGGSVGGGSTCDTTPVLPQLAPFPDIILRESFGPGPNVVRPAGGKGCNKPTYLHTDISGFWVEWPGSKNTAWVTPSATQTWRFCAASDNPLELPSPLQTIGNGCLISEWFNPVLTRPTALVPFTQPNGPYEIHLDTWPAPGDPAYYLGFGITDASLLDRNLETSAGLWMELTNVDLTTYLVTYNVRADGRTGPVLATGTVFFSPWIPATLTYDPVAQTASASLNGVNLGTFPLAARAPKFIGIEGVGVVDNLVVRKLF
ncbi:MAG: hypothetical protein ACM3SO_18035 [Betaproteobacteria bacterium]